MADAPAGGGSEARYDAVAVSFARVLRAAGLSVPIGSVLAFAEALGTVGLGRRDDVYWAGRATLVRRPEDTPLFDRAFAVFWERRQPGPAAPEEPPVHVTLAMDQDDGDGDGSDGDAEPSDEPVIELRFSPAEVL